MKDNAILEEIRKIRDAHAKEHGYNVHKLFSQLRLETEKLKSDGWLVVNQQKLAIKQH